ncbi:MAG TPA: ABC transporter permease, partial [Bryobacteraceae bacterium]|nr:ABC transporter permease [Bryobacteraceae bacterium]
MREDDLDRELRAHLELEAEEQQNAGLTRDEALHAARRALGNITYVKEELREMGRWSSLEHLWQDLRYAARMLRKTPAFTAVALLSLALGIGANTAIFSLLNAMLLRLLPIPNPQQVVQLTYTFPPNRPGDWNSYFGYPHLERFRKQARTLTGVFGGTGLNRVNVGWRGTAGLAQCDAYTGNFFSVMGVAPQRGRLFVPEDDREGADVAVLSDAYWRSRFAADPAMVGQTILIDQVPFTVIGIAPPKFSIYLSKTTRDLWVPLHALDRLTRDPDRWQAPFNSWLMIAGRLRPGVSIRQAEAELDVIHRRLLAEQVAASEFRGSLSGERLVRQSHLLLRPAANGMFSAMRETYALPLKLLMGVAAMVLLISCANVANLVLARASQRRREIALRMALGSGRARVVRQLLTENLLLAGAGGVLALAIAWWGSAALVRMISTGDTPVPLDVRPDWLVFGFAAAVSLASGALFGLVPSLRATRVDPGSALKEGTRGITGSSRTLDRVLVAVQVTLSLVLISGAGLFTRTLENLRHVDVGYQRDNILLFSADAKLAGYSKEQAAALYRAILNKAAALAGVESASVSIVRPVDEEYYLADQIAYVDGRKLPDAEGIRVAWNAMSPGYFQTLGTPILMGRDFDLRDSESAARVVIINESLARQALPGRKPIGHRLDGAEIVGVVKDSLYSGARERPRAVLYRPLFQSAGGVDPSRWVGVGSVSFELRYRSGAGRVDELRDAVAAVDRNVPIFRVKTLRAQTEDSFLRERLLAMISGFFGGLALLLACLGLYGLMAFAVARRTAEIGIRMALGAPQAEIRWLVVREILWLILAGIAAGVPLTVWLSRYAKSLLFGVAPADPVILAVAVAMMAGVAALAGDLPARRASRIDP